MKRRNARLLSYTEVGIYKRKQEKRNSTKKKRKIFLFSWSLSWSSSWFLVFLFSYFLVFFYKFLTKSLLNPDLRLPTYISPLGRSKTPSPAGKPPLKRHIFNKIACSSNKSKRSARCRNGKFHKNIVSI